METPKVIVSTIAELREELSALIGKALDDRISKIQKQMEKRPEIYLTTDEVCERFKVTRQAVNGWMKTGKLVPEKAGRYNRYAESEVERFLASNKKYTRR